MGAEEYVVRPFFTHQPLNAWIKLCAHTFASCGFQQEWGQHSTEKRTQINRKVKPAEHLAQQMPVRFSELIAHMRRYAGLNAS